MANPPSSDPDEVAGAKFSISNLPLMQGIHALLSIDSSLSACREIEKPCSLNLASLLSVNVACVFL